MTFVPWGGLLAGVAMGNPVAVAMEFLLTGPLTATSFALIVGVERRPRRRDPAIALQPPADDRAAAA